MFVTREADYAIRSVLFLATMPGRTASVPEISGPTEVPRSFLAKLLQKLATAGIVESVRGVRGGFRLARPPEEISLLSVIVAIQGPSAVNRCAVDGDSCRRAATCAVHPVWVGLRQEVERRLSAITFRELAAAQPPVTSRAGPEGGAPLPDPGGALPPPPGAHPDGGIPAPGTPSRPGGSARA